MDGISWANMNMLLATIPSYKDKDKECVEEVAPENEEEELRKLIG